MHPALTVTTVVGTAVATIITSVSPVLIVGGGAVGWWLMKGYRRLVRTT